MRLLALLSFAGLPRFRLLEGSALGLTVGLAIGGAESMGGKSLLASLDGHSGSC